MLSKLGMICRSLTASLQNSGAAPWTPLQDRGNDVGGEHLLRIAWMCTVWGFSSWCNCCKCWGRNMGSKDYNDGVLSSCNWRLWIWLDISRNCFDDLVLHHVRQSWCQCSRLWWSQASDRSSEGLGSQLCRVPTLLFPRPYILTPWIITKRERETWCIEFGVYIYMYTFIYICLFIYTYNGWQLRY